MSRQANQDAATTGGLVIVATVSAVVGLIGFKAQLFFFGETSDDAFSSWTHWPLFVAGGLGVILCIAGLVAVIYRAHRHARFAAVGLMALALCGLAVGAGMFHSRSHPQPFERSAIAALNVPPTATTDITSFGSEPEADVLTASPPELGPPVAARSWGTTSCAVLHRVLLEWADHGSVQVPPPLAVAPPCFFSARYHGYQVAASIVDEKTTGMARVVLSPPPVLQ